MTTPLPHTTLPHGYEYVIGLEVHAQVTTQSKLFSGSATAFGAEPNTQANPIDLGMPGMLPVLNAGAVEAGIKLGLAIEAQIAPKSVFARKNYYYPDLPKGYQISQYDQPIVQHGKIEIDVPGVGKRIINITRMHLEEDAGKSVHDLGANVSHVDLNRAGVPLMEIVSEPEIRTPAEAGAYMKAIRTLVRWLGICDGDMEKGNLRCDANISVRKVAEAEGGTFRTRCEIKNLNSIRHIMAAIEHEAHRQIALYEQGGTVAQETRLWDPDKEETRTLRSKEDAHDYRYFPDPDLLPLVITPARIAAVQATMPKLPQVLAGELAALGLSADDITLLTSDKSYADYFAAMLAAGADAKLSCNWLVSELFAVLNKTETPLENSPLSATQLAGLVKLIQAGEISGKIGKQVFAEMLANGGDAREIVAKLGLTQISDEGALRKACAAALAANPDAVAKFKAGNERIFGSFVGFVMKETKGQANPGLVDKILKELLA
jgi:aspartyl-tRNA(Asn)/glutamyl-tRNA(Gln) amidotransferase subunit B